MPPADQDGAEPNANSVTVTNLLRAACYSGHAEWVEKAGQILAAFSERLQKIPLALPEMARATAVFHHTLKQVGPGLLSRPPLSGCAVGPPEPAGTEPVPSVLSLDRWWSAGTPKEKTPKRCFAACTLSSAPTR